MKLINLENSLILDILEKNLNFKRINHEIVGDCVRLPNYEAYLFSIITSYPYLNCNEYNNLTRFSRSFYQIYNQAQEYNFQLGLFDRITLSPYQNTNINIRILPFIKQGKWKFITVLEYKSIQDLNEKVINLIQKLKSSGIPETSFIIILKARSKNNPKDFESFLEYITSRIFNNLNYITDSQIPFYYAKGTPDLAAYKIPILQNLLLNKRFFKIGFSIVEAMTLRQFGFTKINNGKEIKNQENIVFEAKVNQSNATKQIKKYLEMEIFNEAFEIIPVEKNVTGNIGLITLNSNAEIKIIRSPEKPISNNSRMKNYLKWIINYIKCYFLANLEGEELEQILKENGYSMAIDDFNHFIQKSDFTKIMSYIEEYVKH